MKIILIALLAAVNSYASVVGVSTYPFNDEGRMLSAEMTGYMNQRHEMGMGLRYSQELNKGQILDLTAAGGQDSRALIVGAGYDVELLKEESSQPRLSIKPFIQHQKYEDEKSNILGAAPTIRKGLTIKGQELFPYLAVPVGMRINNGDDAFKYYASLTLGAAMPFPGAGTDKLLLSIEGNRNMGSAYDYVGAIVSWVWK